MKLIKMPKYWRQRNGWFSCRVPKMMQPYFDHQPEFMLAKKFDEAMTIYNRRFNAWRKTENCDPITPTTINELIDRYRIDALPEKKPQSVLDYPQHFGRISKGIGKFKISNLKPVHIYTFYDALIAKRGISTANRTIAVLSNMLTYAVRWGSIDIHTMKMAKFTKTYPKSLPENYIPPTTDSLLEALTVANDTIYDYVILKWHIGLRRTDMLQLQVKDICDDGIHVTPSKTKDSTGISTIHLWDGAGEMRKAIDRQIANRTQTDDYVFTTKNGDPYINIETKLAYGFQSMWRRWQDKALLETDLEKRFVERSLRTKSGSDSGSLEEARIRLGHKTDTTTSKHYRLNAEVSTPLKISLVKQA